MTCYTSEHNMTIIVLFGFHYYYLMLLAQMKYEFEEHFHVRALDLLKEQHSVSVTVGDNLKVKLGVLR